MDEFKFIEKIKPKYYKQSTLVKGIGDDAAVFYQPHQQIVTAVDTFVEGIHFSKETMDPFHVGYRGLAASVSDLAAMGAVPKFYLVSVIVPQERSIEEVEEIFRGMAAFGDRYELDLIGGDTVSGSGLSVSMTVIGYAERDKIRYRHQAKDQDIVFVTGSLGNSQAGLHILLEEKAVENHQYFIDKHRYPNPRVDFAKGLAGIDRLSLNDISDGIVNELYEIAEASKVNIVLGDNALPYHKDLKQFPQELRKQWIYFGGEDFELVGTIAAKDWQELEEVASKTKTQITPIGHVKDSGKDQAGLVFVRKNKTLQLLGKEGYTHLK